VDRLLVRLIVGEEAQDVLGFFEGQGVRVPLRQRILARFYQADGALIARRIDTERADDGELFEDDAVAIEVGRGLRTLRPGENDPAAAPSQVDRLRDGLGGVGGNTDDDAGATEAVTLCG